jgi:hypothetical protein
MCCFSVASPGSLIMRLFTPKVHVSSTSIFVRMLEPGVQALAYGMDLKTALEVAMVLPVPVVPGSGESALRFVDLSPHPRMFSELAELFEVSMGQPKGGPLRFSSQQRQLAVHDIGAFVASYVPTRADFSRLDPRFRMPDVLFDAVPQYADYGFAVFQLKPGNVTVHPMAFTFPTRDPEKLYFPTVHVHDGRFRKTAKFDHSLYYQHPRCTHVDTPSPVRGFEGDAASWMTPSKSYVELVDTKRPMVRRTLRAKLPNQDTWIGAT